MKEPHPIEGLPSLFEHFLEQLRAELTTSTGTIPDTGARTITLNGQPAMQVAASPGALMGWSLRESTGAATALVEVRVGNSDNAADASGALIVTIKLAAGESTRDWFGDSGIGFGAGLIVHLVSGAVVGAVYLRAVE